VISLEGQDITAQDEVIETPATGSTFRMNKDFTVSLLSALSTSQDKSSLKQSKYVLNEPLLR
jgi:hypothetical protein